MADKVLEAALESAGDVDSDFSNEDLELKIAQLEAELGLKYIVKLKIKIKSYACLALYCYETIRYYNTKNGTKCQEKCQSRFFFSIICSLPYHQLLQINFYNLSHN